MRLEDLQATHDAVKPLRPMRLVTTITCCEASAAEAAVAGGLADGLADCAAPRPGSASSAPARGVRAQARG